MKIRSRILLLLLLLLVIAVASWYYFSLHRAGSSSGAQPPSGPVGRPKLEIEKARASYRLKPDGRFLLAFAELQHLLAGKPGDPAAAEFVNGKWRVSFGKAAVGTLPEYPDYEDFMVVLTSWGKTIRPEWNTGLAEAPAELEEALKANDGLAAVKIADRAWGGSGSVSLLVPSARAMILLYTQTPSGFLSDETIAARAIAMTAAARIHAPSRLTSDESLLAYHLGYSHGAEQLAAGLADTDPVRLFVSARFDELRRSAVSPAATAQAKYLYLSRLAATQDERGWSDWTREYFPGEASPAVVKAGLDMRGFDSILRASAEAIRTAAAEAQETPGSVSGESIHKGIETFESSLKKESPSHKGRLWDSKAYEAYCRSYMYTGLSAMGLHYVDDLASVEATEEFAGRLGTFSEGVAKEFQEWYQRLSNFEKGETNLAEMARSLNRNPDLGGDAVIRTFQEMQPWMRNTETTTRPVVRQVAAQLDTRPGQRMAFARVVHDGLLDLKLAEQLASTSLACSHVIDGHDLTWAVAFLSDKEQFIEWMNSPFLTAHQKGDLMNYLKDREDIEPREMHDIYQKLVPQEPDYYHIRGYYAAYLARRKEYGPAAAVLESWLRSHGPEEEFGYIHARVDLADLYLKLDKTSLAWKTVEPVVGSGQGDALREGARALDRMGKKKEAMDLAQADVGRYPGSPYAWAILLELLWKNGRYEETATVLDRTNPPITKTDWCYYVGKRFAEVFSDLPEEEALKALDALTASQTFGRSCGCLARGVKAIGKPSLAFRMIQNLNTRKMASEDILLTAYACLKETEGKEKAVAWLRETMAGNKFNNFIVLALMNGEYDLIWDLPSAEQARHPMVWLMRAASSLRMPDFSEERRQMLKDFYSGSQEAMDSFRRSGMESAYRAGQYMVGIMDQKALMDRAKDRIEQCEGAFYVGFKLESEGNYYDASDWYRLAIETEVTGNMEFGWAIRTLVAWQATGRTLKYDAEKKVGTSADPMDAFVVK